MKLHDSIFVYPSLPYRLPIVLCHGNMGNVTIQINQNIVVGYYISYVLEYLPFCCTYIKFITQLNIETQNLLRYQDSGISINAIAHYSEALKPT